MDAQAYPSLSPARMSFIQVSFTSGSCARVFVSATSCSYHHWLLTGSTPAEFKAIELEYGSNNDSVVLVQPIPSRSNTLNDSIFHGRLSDSFSLA